MFFLTCCPCSRLIVSRAQCARVGRVEGYESQNDFRRHRRVSSRPMLSCCILHINLQQASNDTRRCFVLSQAKIYIGIFPYSPLPSGTWRTPGLSIPWGCLPTSSSVCLVFFPLSLCIAKWFSPDPMNWRHVLTTAVCVSLWWSGGLCVVQSHAGSWHGLPCWKHGLCTRCAEHWGSTSFPWLVYWLIGANHSLILLFDNHMNMKIITKKSQQPS